MVKKIIVGTLLVISVLINIFFAFKTIEISNYSKAEKDIVITREKSDITVVEQKDFSFLHLDESDIIALAKIYIAYDKSIDFYEKINLYHDTEKKLWKVSFILGEEFVGGTRHVFITEKGELICSTTEE